MQQISLEEALKVGKRKLVLMPILVFALPILIIAILFLLDLASEWHLIPAFFVGFVLAFYYWSLHVMDWKIWAFTEVRNVHKLEKKAIQNYLIWPRDSFFNRFEITSKENEKLWQELQSKFEQEDVFFDNPAIPKETTIYFSKKEALTEAVISLVILFVALWMIFNHENYNLGGLMALLTAYFGNKAFQRFQNRKPQITINNEMIILQNETYYPWQSIYAEEVVKLKHGNSISYELQFTTNAESINLEVENLNIKPEQLEELLEVYRWRFDNE